MFTTEEVLAAYKKLNVKPCSGEYYTYGACCPMTAIYLANNDLELLSPAEMDEETDGADDIHNYHTKKYGIMETLSFRHGFDWIDLGYEQNEATAFGKELCKLLKVEPQWTLCR